MLGSDSKQLWKANRTGIERRKTSKRQQTKFSTERKAFALQTLSSCSVSISIGNLEIAEVVRYFTFLMSYHFFLFFLYSLLSSSYSSSFQTILQRNPQRLKTIVKYRTKRCNRQSPIKMAHQNRPALLLKSLKPMQQNRAV